MFFAEALAMIVMTMIVCGTLGGIIAISLKHRREMAKIEYGANRPAELSAPASELEDTVSLMQDRLVVLEQIATDPARRTADEIERLR